VCVHACVCGSFSTFHKMSKYVNVIPLQQNMTEYLASALHVSSYLVLGDWVWLQICLHKQSSWFLVDYFEEHRSIVIPQKGVGQLTVWGALHGNNICECRGVHSTGE